jgi:salicylate hydroxylase
MTPNATKLLKRWDLSEYFWNSAARPSSINFRRYSDGTILFREKNYNPGLMQKYGSETLNISRVDVQKGLYDRAKDLGVEFHFGTKVVEVDMDGGRVKSAAGLEFQGDLVIGADGIWSRCREVLLGKQDYPEATGDLVYRIILNAEDVPAGELRDKITNPELNIWFGPDCHAVSYSMKGGTALGLGLVRPDDLPAGVSKKEGSPDEMRELFRNWDPM